MTFGIRNPGRIARPAGKNSGVLRSIVGFFSLRGAQTTDPENFEVDLERREPAANQDS